MVGLEKTWKKILEGKSKESEKYSELKTEDFGELYEQGLAHLDKDAKKNLGKYYTPSDVSRIMATWLKGLNGQKVADVGCGTGNLILSYLELIGRDEARSLILDGNLYLYDLDKTALSICCHTIALLYGDDLLGKINAICGDFLDKDIAIPNDCKVISNPPYAKITAISSQWQQTSVQKESRELYAAFLEKISQQSKSAVVITPYSFCGARKFFSLRKVMSERNGFIVSFDNVPGNIFKGQKHGIFNSNHANSVRASITVLENSGTAGIRLSPLIRFSTAERKQLLDVLVLEKLIGLKKQKVSDKEQKFRKCFREIEPIVDSWQKRSTEKLGDLIQRRPNDFRIEIPNTCRYFCVASSKELKRTGKHVIFAKNQEAFDYLYAFVNSSFLYLQWRMYDGGINLTSELLKTTPTFFRLVKDKGCLRDLVEQVKSEEENYLVYKPNANALQENIKFPLSVRDSFNKILLNSLDLRASERVFDLIHSNCIFAEAQR